MNEILLKKLGFSYSEINEQSIKALNRMIDLCDLERKTDEELIEIIEWGELTCNNTRSDRLVLWYISNGIEHCIYIDTLEELDNIQIEMELL